MPVDMTQGIPASGVITSAGDGGSVPSAFDASGQLQAAPATGGLNLSPQTANVALGGSSVSSAAAAAAGNGAAPYFDASGQLQAAPSGINLSPQVADVSGGFPAGGTITTGATAAPAAGGTITTGTNWGNLQSDPLGTLTSAVKNNPLLAAGALGMGYNMIKGDQQPKGYNQLQSEAQALGSQGAQLQQEALNNSLPPAAQAQLNEAANAMKAQIRTTYAQMGLSGSSMEAQQMAGVDAKVASEGYQMTQSLLQQGVQESNMASQLYAQLLNANSQQAAAQTSAIGNFAGALGGAGLKGALA